MTKYYKLPELAALVGLSPKTLYRRRDDGILKGQNFGGLMLYTWQDWLNSLNKTEFKPKTDDKRRKYKPEIKGRKTIEKVLTNKQIREM